MARQRTYKGIAKGARTIAPILEASAGARRALERLAAEEKAEQTWQTSQGTLTGLHVVNKPLGWVPVIAPDRRTISNNLFQEEATQAFDIQVVLGLEQNSVSGLARSILWTQWFRAPKEIDVANYKTDSDIQEVVDNPKYGWQRKLHFLLHEADYGTGQLITRTWKRVTVPQGSHFGLVIGVLHQDQSDTNDTIDVSIGAKYIESTGPYEIKQA